MNDFLIFTALVVVVLFPLFIITFLIIFKKTINFPVSVLMTINSGVTSILAFLTAKIGLVHLFWAAPAVMLVVIGCILYFRKFVSKPLKQLTDDINQVATGNTNITIDTHLLNKENEIGSISQSLNNMLINLRQSVKTAELVSQGRLYSASAVSDALKNKGDLDLSMENMIVKLNAIIAEINTSSEIISRGSEEISASSQAVSQGASEQAASIEEISSSMEEMVAVIIQNAENSEQSQKMAEKSAKNIRLVHKALDNTINSIKSISEKTSIINEIAAKTDLLAINASIEAARAGEYGKGFAIVAGEIRRLAEKSQNAAATISDLSSNTVQDASNAGELLSEVIPDIEKTKQLVQDVAVSCEEQRTGANQINAAIIQLNQVTQGNAASSEELASGSQEFAKQAEILKNSVAFFRIEKSHEADLRNEILGKIEEMNRFVKESFGEEIEPLKEKKIEKKILKKETEKGLSIDMNDKLDNEYEKI